MRAFRNRGDAAALGILAGFHSASAPTVHIYILNIMMHHREIRMNRDGSSCSQRIDRLRFERLAPSALFAFPSSPIDVDATARTFGTKATERRPLSVILPEVGHHQ